MCVLVFPYLRGTICSTEGCSLIWDTVLNSLVRITRKIQPCVGSQSTEPGYRVGQIMTVLFQGNLLTVSTQGEAGSQHPRKVSRTPGTSSRKKRAQKLKGWRSRGSGCGDRRVSRDPRPGLSHRARSLLSRQAPHQESWHTRAQLSSKE